MLSCLKPLDDWDPAQGEEIMTRLWTEFAKKAGTNAQELKKAYSRIVFDGYYGPVPDEEWNIAHETEEDTGHMSMALARSLLRKALDHDPHVTFFHPDIGCSCGGAEHCNHPDHEATEDNGPMFHEEECTVDPYEIKRELFHGLIEIYGHLSI